MSLTKEQMSQLRSSYSSQKCHYCGRPIPWSEYDPGDDPTCMYCADEMEEYYLRRENDASRKG